MKKVFISVRDCRPGMKIAEDIFNDYGAVIIADGTILDEHIIGRITDLGFTRIRIYDTEEDINKVSGSDLFRTQYIETSILSKVSCTIYPAEKK